MENRKGSGIFLGIVSIATLIVAIIGATFAYFSATTQSADDAVNLTAYDFQLTMDVTRIYPAIDTAAEKVQLIPMNPTGEVNGYTTGTNGTNLLYALNEATERCIDGNQLQVCALYEVTIYNESQQTIELTGELHTVNNIAAAGDKRTGFVNLMYQPITGTLNNLVLDGAAKSINDDDGIVAISDITALPATTETVKDDESGEETEQVVPGEGKAYVLVYLNDNGDQSAEMGAQFTGKIVYQSKDGAQNQLSAMFKIGE